MTCTRCKTKWPLEDCDEGKGKYGNTTLNGQDLTSAAFKLGLSIRCDGGMLLSMSAVVSS